MRPYNIWLPCRLVAGPLYKKFSFMNLEVIRYRTFIFALVTILSLGCSQKPSNSEVKVAVKNSLNNFQPCNLFELEEIQIDKIGLVQEENSVKWWPARVLLFGKCKVPIYEEIENRDQESKNASNQEVIDLDDLFGVHKIGVEMRDSTLEIEFRLDKNMYDEWIASPID